MSSILLFGTFDTKLDPLVELHGLILNQDPSAKIIVADLGRTPTQHPIITHTHASLFGTAWDLASMPRDQVVRVLTQQMAAQIRVLHAQKAIHAAISLGGSCGTTIAADAMRAVLPVGFPKLIISTMASGEVSHYIQESDIVLMPSIVDIAGSNRILSQILANAAGAITGMARAARAYQKPAHKKTVAVSMFGITTPAVTHAQKYLEAQGIEVIVLHATGAGGKVLEELARKGELDGVLDLTTTEITDEVCGGVLSAGPKRLTAAARAGIPQIISTGATDCINFGPVDTLPERIAHPNQQRRVVEHNPAVTIVRTTVNECLRIGSVIGNRIKNHTLYPDLVEVWCPMRGVSVLSEQEGPFYDPEADGALVDALKQELIKSDVRIIIDSGAAINDERFAVAMAKRLVELMKDHELKTVGDCANRMEYMKARDDDINHVEELRLAKFIDTMEQKEPDETMELEQLDKKEEQKRR